MPALVSLSHISGLVTKNHLHRTPRKNLSLFPNLSPRISITSKSYPSHSCSLSSLAPLEAILFDIDGTLCDSDPLHYHAFYEMLQEVSFNGGVPITEEFFMEKIHGKHNDQLCGILFPDWDFERAITFMNNKEAMFRRLAAENLQPLNGLKKLCQWIEDRGLKRAAVTNAPRPNAELLISMLSLADFFEIVILGNECERAKPFPDPYLKGLCALEVSPKHTFAFEDSVSGIKAAVAAGIPVVGLATRNTEKLLLEAGAVFVINDFDDPKLWTALEELENKAEMARANT
ncbi:Haloacid dehalogenase-like hydrolase domain-containing protein Sgpp [Actinidia chinensis var. chinensis]|uniref:Haloacid dehalogenase-like hydrolase domain-containing protein Sgpp n=1 Tax=Actinidia chinensis var. chinensis TaxID=1590841 RepID=A0A2R6RBA9_ACTCC|nr:Haloacid dehalogenase-like hydrolase domain-containing protein Sgpp [Actinidia chinensis var. chinensis]